MDKKGFLENISATGVYHKLYGLRKMWLSLGKQNLCVDLILHGEILEFL